MNFQGVLSFETFLLLSSLTLALEQQDYSNQSAPLQHSSLEKPFGVFSKGRWGSHLSDIIIPLPFWAGGEKVKNFTFVETFIAFLPMFYQSLVRKLYVFPLYFGYFLTFSLNGHFSGTCKILNKNKYQCLENFNFF